jgi:hypothetical protein
MTILVGRESFKQVECNIIASEKKDGDLPVGSAGLGTS